jgi:glutathione S-transferase
VDLKNKPKDLLELNPYAKVPVLVDGEGVLYESAIVNEYLEEKYVGALSLLPRNELKKAQARIWIDFFNSRIHPAAHDITHDKNPEQAKEQMAKHLKTLDQEMAGKRFIVGDYSLADITFIPFYTRRQRYGVTIDDTLPNLKRWGEELVARPAVVSTLQPIADRRLAAVAG